MNCPTCRSNYTRSARIVWESATRWGYRYQSTSELGLRCAPPERRRLVSEIGGVFAGLGLFVWCWIYGVIGIRFFVQNDTITGFTESLPTLLVCALWYPAALAAYLSIQMILRARHDRTTHLDEIAAWHQSWVCMKCGERFNSFTT